MTRFTAAAILALVCMLIPVAAQAVGDQSADLSGCAAPYIPQCGCGLVMNPQTKTCVKGNNSYKCTCQQTDSGALTSGMCIAQNKCLATKTNGQTPQQPTAQQLQQANNGNSAQGASGTSGSSAVSPGTSGTSAQITPASGVTLPQSETSNAGAGLQQTSAQTQDSNSIVPGTSVFENAAQDAFKWLTGEENTAPTNVSNIAPGDTSNENIIFNPQPMVPTVPTDQVQSLTSEAPTSPTGEGTANSDYQPSPTTFSQTVSEPMGSLQSLTPEQVQSGNSYAEDTLANQANGQTAPQDTNNVTGSIYYPGCVDGPSGCDVGVEGGLYGSKGNLLDPNVPTVAAGYQSGYQYGQVLNINNPDTGLSVNAAVGDVCPGCGKGIDLTPAAASAIGLTQEQGVGNLQVGVVANTPSYSDGSQMAVALNTNPNALNPWSAPPAVSIVSYSQPDFASLSTPTTWTEAPLEPLPAYPVASVETGPALEQPYPTAQVEQGSALAEPQPIIPVTSEPLPLSEQQVASLVPTPESIEINPQSAVEATNDAYASSVLSNLPQPESVTNGDIIASIETTNATEQPSSLTPYPTTPVESSELQPAGTAIPEQQNTYAPANTPSLYAQLTQSPSASLGVPEPLPAVPTQQVTSSELPPPEQTVSEIPTPPTETPTGEEITQQVQNAVAQENEQAAQLAIEGTGGPSPSGFDNMVASMKDSVSGVWNDFTDGVNTVTASLFGSQENAGQLALDGTGGPGNAETQTPIAGQNAPPSIQDNGENPLALTEQNVPPTNSTDIASAPIVPAEANDFSYPPTSENQTAQPSEPNNANPYDSGNQFGVTATCEGGGGACGKDSTSAAAGGTPLNGETAAIAVPKDNPYGLKIGDTVSVQIGGNVAQNIPVTDYTGSSGSNYVVSGALEQELGGTGKDAALITPTAPSEPLPGATLIGQGGIGSDYVASQQQPSTPVQTEAQLAEQSLNYPLYGNQEPLSSAVTLSDNEGLAFAPPGYQYGWAEPSENEALAFGAPANSQDEALAYGGSTPASADQQTTASSNGNASDIASANPSNDERLQQAQNQAEPPTVLPPQQTPMQALQTKLNNALNFVQNAQQTAQSGGNNNLTQQQYNYLRSVAAATGNAGSVPSYASVSGMFNGLGGGWTGIAGNRAISTVQDAISGLKK